MDKNKKKRKIGIKLPVYFLSLFVVALISVGLTYWLVTNGLFQTNPIARTNPESKQPITEIKNVEGFQNIEAVYEIILSNYIENVDEKDLIEGALSGMVSAVQDPYSQYLNIDESENMNDTISASFEGIGAEIMSMDDQITIVSPIKGSPAEENGLLPNDIILSADDVSLQGMTATEAVTLIRGERGSTVTLEIKRGTQVFTVDIVRDTIPIETVGFHLDENHDKIGVVAVYNFARPTYQEIVDAVQELRTQGAEKFVFDFRQNPGGLLDQALKIANMFVEDGAILLQTEEKGSEPYIIQASDQEYGAFQIKEPAVMLIDEGSASASEIVAGVMKEEAEVPLVGTTSFGKGTVQSIYPLTAKSELKLTVAKWLTPEGNWIHDEGIEPDYKVNLPDYAFLTLIDTSETYELGAVSEAVSNVEEILEAVGYAVTADGYLDYDTVAAIEQFQVDNQLKPSGVLDDETARVLTEELREVIQDNDTQYAKAIEVLEGLSE